MRRNYRLCSGLQRMQRFWVDGRETTGRVPECDEEADRFTGFHLSTFQIADDPNTSSITERKGECRYRG